MAISSNEFKNFLKQLHFNDGSHVLLALRVYIYISTTNMSIQNSTTKHAIFIAFLAG